MTLAACPTEAKIVLLGSAMVAKTSIVARATTNNFNLGQTPTVGTQDSTKIVTTDVGTITLRIWDTAGQGCFRALAQMCY
jgi:Ras-related protein Rab-6C